MAEALLRLAEITRRLRRDCPWDREQDERSIVPHTVEEAYELADAAHSGDDGRFLDELGDVLYQVFFLSLLLEERGAGDLAAVADHCREKLIRRHPHVFGEARADTAGEVLHNWGELKRLRERGGEVFGELPENLPALLHALKLQRRAEGAGLEPGRPAAEALAELRRRCDDFRPGAPPGDEAFELIGALLFDVVAAARALEVDPELALRQTANQYRRRVEVEQRGA